MESSSPDYKQLFLQAQRAQQEAERARQEAERAQQEAERAQQEELERRQEAERAQQEELERRQEAERVTRKTTLPEFLDACHAHFYSPLAVQTDASLSTRGDPSNADDKVMPDKVREWKDFPAQQEKVWQLIAESDFLQERHFTSINTVREIGETTNSRMVGSELDLHHFERTTIDNPVTLALRKLYENPYLRRKFRLRGLIQFENHGNTISPEEEISTGMRRMQISEEPLRRSRRLMRGNQTSEVEVDTAPGAALVATDDIKISRPRADQFCVYNISSDTADTASRIAVFIIEYKPPHKLSLGHIYEGLGEMTLADVVTAKDTDGSKEHCRRLVAAAITQAYSYMIMAGLEFGCVRTGEACIFLRVPDDPRTLYYFLSVPKGDVGLTTGWEPEKDNSNRLHLTAVGQMLAFTLQTLRRRPRRHPWRINALQQLSKWNIAYNDLVEAAPVENTPSEYRPSPYTDFVRSSPIRLRRAAHQQSSSHCAPEVVHTSPSDSDGSDPETPSRQRRPRIQGIVTAGPSQTLSTSTSTSRTRRGSGNARQYCTHMCLLGLLGGSALDMNCPNVHDHGRNGHHPISHQTFLLLLWEQLKKSVDENFDESSRPGRRGVLFKVTLVSHGYTIAAKCGPRWSFPHLEYESMVYHRLRPIQGVYIPVHLGLIGIPSPYFYEGAMILSHAMLLSFGGTPVSRHVESSNIERLCQQADVALGAIHALGVRHKDALSRNMLYDDRNGQVMVIDFDCAEMRRLRQKLGVISGNRKRKFYENDNVKGVIPTYPLESGQLRTELQCIVRSTVPSLPPTR